MADNVIIPLTGSGDATATVATDTIGGVAYQRVKVNFGADGTSTDASATDPLPTTIAVLNPLDYDTGGGTVSQGIIGIALPASGGPVGVSSSNPLPVTAASFPLPTGAATAANQATEIASLASIDGKITAVNTGAVVVASSALPSGASTSAAQGTGNTSLASIDGKITAVNTGAVVVSSSALPSGASTAAKQPALGTAGTASADVISVQGIASMTPVQVSQATATNLKAEITIAAAQTLATVTTVGTVSTITTLPALPANQSVNVAQINGVTPLMGAGNTGTGSPRVTIATDQAVIPVGGDVANDGVDSGNPVKIGGKALAAPPTAVAAADRVNAQFNIYGEQIVRHSLRETKVAQQTQISSSTSETTILTADGTYKLDLYGLVLTNSSATASKVTIKDDTAGTTRFVFMVPAGETRGFMLPSCDGHKQAAANKNWTATCGTSVAAIEITAMAVQNL